MYQMMILFSSPKPANNETPLCLEKYEQFSQRVLSQHKAQRCKS